MSTSNRYNQGIFHLIRKSGAIACNNRRAIMAVTAEDFGEVEQCKKCAAVFAKWQKIKEQRQGV